MGRLVKLVVPIIGIGLQNAGEVAKMPDGMFMPSVPRGIIERRRRCPSPKRPVVADIGPDVPLDVLPFARIGTVVSSPCSRSAARTWRSINP